MNRIGLILAAFALTTTFALWGCGGDSGGNASLAGSWSGTQTRVVDGTTDFDFTLSETSVGGTARHTTADTPPVTYTGTVSGSFTGNALDVTVTWNNPTGYGTTHFTGTENDNQIVGTFTHTPAVGTPETGSLTIVKSGAATPTNLTGNYTGSAHDNANNTDVTLSESITQNGNSLSGNITATDPTSGAQTGTFTGSIFGNHFLASAPSLGGHPYIFDGTVSGLTITGNFDRTDSSNHIGTFILTQTSTR